MREIKFRAWNEKDEKMYYNGYFTIDNSEPSWLFESDKVSFHSHFGTIMQFTGLKDKNGKEIYEGDVLEINGIIGEVVFDNDEASFRFETNKDISYWNKDWTQRLLRTEVLGNKFENPELLK